jgi:hypothetical protein
MEGMDARELKSYCKVTRYTMNIVWQVKNKLTSNESVKLEGIFLPDVNM